MQYLNEEELRKGLAVMHGDGGVFEIRIIANDKRTFSGYFTDAETAIRELRRQDLRGCNVYATLNRLNPACYDREQKDRFVGKPKATTADGDVTDFRVLMVDIDPRRPSGTSSSDAELQAAKDVGNRVFTFMRQLGFSKPILAYSGNGVHLLYRIDIPNTDENKRLVKTCLQALDMLFSNKTVAVDTSNFNPARVCKLVGSLAQKGSNSKDRPHRMATMLSKEDAPITTADYLAKLAGMMPKEPEKPQYYNHYNPGSFDLEEWMQQHGLRYTPTPYSDGIKYVLDHCPFDESHTGKDAAIFKSVSTVFTTVAKEKLSAMSDCYSIRQRTKGRAPSVNGRCTTRSTATGRKSSRNTSFRANSRCSTKRCKCWICRKWTKHSSEQARRRLTKNSVVCGKVRYQFCQACVVRRNRHGCRKWS